MVAVDLNCLGCTQDEVGDEDSEFGSDYVDSVNPVDFVDLLDLIVVNNMLSKLPNNLQDQN